MTKSKRFTVFEVANRKRKELYYGLTERPVFETIKRLDRSLPAPITHWNLNDVENIRSLEFDLSSAEARALVQRLARMPQPEGWRALTDPHGKPETE